MLTPVPGLSPYSPRRPPVGHPRRGPRASSPNPRDRASPREPSRAPIPTPTRALVNLASPRVRHPRTRSSWQRRRRISLGPRLVRPVPVSAPPRPRPAHNAATPRVRHPRRSSRARREGRGRALGARRVHPPVAPAEFPLRPGNFEVVRSAPRTQPRMHRRRRVSSPAPRSYRRVGA